MIIFKLLWNCLSVFFIFIVKAVFYILMGILWIVAEIMNIGGALILTVAALICELFVGLAFLCFLFNQELGELSLLVIVIFVLGLFGLLLGLAGPIFIEFLRDKLQEFIWFVSLTALCIPLSCKRKADSSGSRATSEKADTAASDINIAAQLFVGITDKESLKKRYHDLLKIYHPDNHAGNTGMAQYIQQEYERLLNSSDMP